MFVLERTGFDEGLICGIIRVYLQVGPFVVLARLLPIAAKSFIDLHNLRLQSVTAHPRNKKTGKATRRLKHYGFYKIHPVVKNAIIEIIDTITP
jgi:hypothetical protein